MTLDLTKEQIYSIKSFLAFVLRHKPHYHRIKLDNDGYADMEPVIRAVKKDKNISITKEQLIEISKRYSGGIFLVTENKIKARDGHTVIFNMSIPDGYIETGDVPKTLYVSMNKSDVGKILLNDGIVFADAKVFMLKELPKLQDGKTTIIINSQKAKSDSIKFYSNADTYFAKHIASRYISVHV